ncbi:MAG: glucose-6-phosphate isomerase, partial [bacterium]|nr:glucose-6-phosphate isomerase [bacterium]
MHDTVEWQALSTHREALHGVHLRELFDGDSNRGERLVAETDGLLLDYSKNRLTDETMELLPALADRAGLRHRIEAMFSGEPVNTTENRPAWHVALRQPNPPPEVSAEFDRMAEFAAEARSGRWQSVVNIGIGGSDLGPAMATAALGAFADTDLDVRFLSNIDGAHFREVTQGLDPAQTLFIVVSKTFTTTETLT